MGMQKYTICKYVKTFKRQELLEIMKRCYG